MIDEILREEIATVNEEALLFDNPSFDKSIIGVTQEGRVVYAYEKMVEELCADENWDEQDAIDWIEVNTIPSLCYQGENKPEIIYPLMV